MSSIGHSVHISKLGNLFSEVNKTARLKKKAMSKAPLSHHLSPTTTNTEV